MASVELHGISLSYPVLEASDLSIVAPLKKHFAGGRIRKTGRTLEVCALEDISFRIGDGERVGIIGHNGAGKTSLLKVIAGIYRGQTGRYERTGRLATVINPGNGLQLDISGYENIENLGLLNGLTREEIRRKIPDIEDFAELGDFLYLPVATYSSGMMARLSFAVATSLSPDILVVDENLSTGDSRFVEKAKSRMTEMMRRSSILVFASHALPMLPEIVGRAILLEHGRIVADGPVDDVVEQYRKSTAAAGGA